MRYCPACGARLETRCHEGRDRPTCPACGFVWYADPKVVVALLIRSEGRVLLGRRTNETGRGRWALPGGFVDRGEALETAARREAREELGVDVVIGPLLGLHSADGDPVVLAVYAATITADTPRPGDDLDAVAYFAPDALPELAFARDGEIVQGAGPRFVYLSGQHAASGATGGREEAQDGRGAADRD